MTAGPHDLPPSDPKLCKCSICWRGEVAITSPEDMIEWAAAYAAPLLDEIETWREKLVASLAEQMRLKLAVDQADTTLSFAAQQAGKRIMELEAERDALKQDAERYRWLCNSIDNSLYLSRNEDHSVNYVTAKEWIEEYDPDCFKHIDIAEAHK